MERKEKGREGRKREGEEREWEGDTRHTNSLLPVPLTLSPLLLVEA